MSSYQGDAYDTPTQAGAMLDNMAVEKVGRTTQHTHGRVIGQIYGRSSYSVFCRVVRIQRSRFF